MAGPLVVDAFAAGGIRGDQAELADEEHANTATKIRRMMDFVFRGVGEMSVSRFCLFFFCFCEEEEIN